MPEKEKMIFKTFRTEVKSVDDKEGVIDMLIPMSTASIDRDKESIDPNGWKKSLPAFKKRAILVSTHGYSDLRKQIGEFIQIKIAPEGLLAKPKYYINQGNEEADWGFKLASKGKAAYSVGFIPIKWEDSDDDKKPKRTFLEQELLEISHVIVPSNRDAIQEMRSKSEDPIVNKVIDDILEEDGLIEIEDEDKEGEEIKYSDVEKPFPNEHACRIRNPGDFKPESFRRISRTSDGKKYSVIMGRLKGEITMTEQAYRYPKDTWTVSQAKKHCKDHEGIAFEPAAEKEEESKEDKLKEIGLFDVNEIYETLKESKELKLKVDELDKDIKELELKVGAVLNAKNKQNLKNAQNLIQSVLDSAEVNEDSLEIEDEKDSKEEDSVIELEDSKVDDKLIDEEKDKDKIEVDEKVIAKAIDDKMGYIMGKVKQSDTKNKIRKEVTK